jgi:acetyl-CoA carboxylase biotin carboxyl carrier protein
MTWRAGNATDQRADEPETVLLAVERILGALTDRPHRMRVRTADFVIDLDWQAQQEMAVAVGPVAEPAVGERTELADTRTRAELDTPAHHHVLAPSVGTFYCAAEPDAAPFVTAGQRVVPGQQIAIVEIMKLMLAIESDVAGTVVELLKSDGEPVEFGEPVLVIAPDEAA